MFKNFERSLLTREVVTVVWKLCFFKIKREGYSLQDALMSSLDKGFLRYLRDVPALPGLRVICSFAVSCWSYRNVPRTHFRSTEVLFVLEGVLNVGLVDTINKL